MTYRMTFPYAPEAVLWQGVEVPLIDGELTAWREYHYGWPFRLVGRENEGRTLVLVPVEPEL